MRRVLLPTLILPFLVIFSHCSRKETAFKNYEPIKWKDHKVNSIAEVNKKINNLSENIETSSSNVTQGQFENEGNVRKVQTEIMENNEKLSNDGTETLDISENKSNIKPDRADRKALKKQIKDKLKSNDSDVNVLLLVLIAILIPPVAVGIVRGWTSGAFFLNILLTILFYLPGLIHALVVIFSSEE